MKLIFIAGAGHSGSTLLELILSNGVECVGIGESFQLVDPRNPIIYHLSDQYCSCGKLLTECRFWGSITLDLKGYKAENCIEKYTVILDKFNDQFGNSKVIVDSSKVPEALELLTCLKGITVKVIHLIRDVRPWVVSMQNTYKRNKVASLSDNIKKYGLKGGYKYLKRTRMYDYHYWYWINKKIENVIDSKGVESICLNYEDLCFSPEETLRKLCSFVGINYSDRLLTTFDKESHNAFGNRMKHNPKKKQKIVYDNRWFYDGCWVFPSFLFPYIMKYNTKVALQNKEAGIWEE